jgi:hypothetical protein
MSERTAKALAKLDELLPLLKTLPPQGSTGEMLDSAEALRRAVAAFHMEAIRFRMYSVDRMLRKTGDERCLHLFEEVRSELETAGFHTRSHSAP